MSFLKRLFSGKSAAQAEVPTVHGEPEIYNGFTIRATPFKEAGQFQTCGVISKEVDGEMKEHRFIRADRFPGIETAVETTMRKARQIIDEQGDLIFRA